MSAPYGNSGLTFPQATKYEAASSSNAFEIFIFNVPGPHRGIQSRHIGGGSSVLPPEGHPSLEPRSLQHIRKELCVFLVCQIMGDLFCIGRQAHGLANLVEVSVTVARDW